MSLKLKIHQATYRVLTWFIKKVGAIGLAFAVIACSQSAPKNDTEFIEYIWVEGVCSEDHVRQSSIYSGSFVHWHNRTKNKHTRYGSIFHQEDNSIVAILHPNKYRPPFSVKFWSIHPDQFTSSYMTIKGISEHILLGGSEGGPQYETTCQLTVMERLDHFPSRPETNRINERLKTVATRVHAHP